MTVLNVDGQKGVKHDILRQTGYSVIVELLVWDSLLMPLSLAIGGKITTRIITRFTALMV